MGLLTQTAEATKEVLGVKTIAVVVDKGYFKIEDIEACEKAGIEPYVPRPQHGPSVKAGLFREDEFQYDAASDSYVCPVGRRQLPYSSSLLHGLKKINYVNRLACDDCAIRSGCTGGKFRTVSRLENEDVLDRMQARLAKRPEVLDRRRPRDGRTSVRLDQAVDEPGGVSDAWLEEGACRIQPDRACLQSQTGPQYRRVRRADGRGGGLNARCLGIVAGRGDTIAENNTVERVVSQRWPRRPIVALLVPSRRRKSTMAPQSAFSHGLLDFCNPSSRFRYSPLSSNVAIGGRAYQGGSVAGSIDAQPKSLSTSYGTAGATRIERRPQRVLPQRGKGDGPKPIKVLYTRP
jgi:hypothetical protein